MTQHNCYCYNLHLVSLLHQFDCFDCVLNKSERFTLLHFIKKKKEQEKEKRKKTQQLQLVTILNIQYEELKASRVGWLYDATGAASFSQPLWFSSDARRPLQKPWLLLAVRESASLSESRFHSGFSLSRFEPSGAALLRYIACQSLRKRRAVSLLWS